MKKLIFFPLSAFLFACSSPAAKVSNKYSSPDTSFHFVYTEYYRETSKDSHHYSTSYSLEKGKLTYDYNYGGFPGPEKKHDEVSVTDTMIQKLRDKLKELKLYINYAKRFPVEKRGMIVETGESLYFTDGKESFKITIDGGRPMDMNDKISEQLSQFRYFVEQYFKK